MIAAARINRRQSLVGLAVGAMCGPVQAQDEGQILRGTFPTRSRQNPVIVVTGPAGAGPMSGTTLLLLHGSGGLQSALPVFLENGRRLAALGYRVVMPVYFSEGWDAAETDDPAWWAQAVEDAATWAMALPGADPNRLVAMGYSRGGYLAAEVAVRTTDIAAVVGVASAGHVRTQDIVRRPPVLLIHARRDPVVPAARTRRWANILREAGVPVEVKALDLSRHAFEDTEWREMFDQADAFFRRALSPEQNPS